MEILSILKERGSKEAAKFFLKLVNLLKIALKKGRIQLNGWLKKFTMLMLG
jgi:hypothetical protein